MNRLIRSRRSFDHSVLFGLKFIVQSSFFSLNQKFFVYFVITIDYDHNVASVFEAFIDSSQFVVRSINSRQRLEQLSKGFVVHSHAIHQKWGVLFTKAK